MRFTTITSDWLRVHRRFAGALGPVPLYIFIIFIFGAFASVLNISITLFSRVLFDYVGPLRSTTLLVSLLKVGLVFVFAKFLASVISNVLDTLIATRFREKTSAFFFGHILKLPLGSAGKYETGDFINRVHNEIGNIKTILLDIPGSFFLSCAVFCFYIYIVFSMNHFVTFLVLVGIPINLLQTRYFSAQLVVLERKALAMQSRLITFLQERLSRLPLIKSFGRENVEHQNYGNLVYSSNQILVASKIVQIIRALVGVLTLDLWRTVIMWYLVYCIVTGKMTNGEVVALMMLTRVVDLPVDALSASYTQWKLAMASIDRIEEIVSQPVEKTVNASATKPPVSKTLKLNFQSVDFSYPNRDNVLNGVTFSAAAGNPAAIVGPSGAGKTTIVNLLSQLIVPSRGRITIDGADFNELGPAAVRKMVGVVSQESRFYQTTLRDNLAYGNGSLTDAEIEKAIDLVGLSSLYALFPRGLDTIINEEVLSGGQKQRFSLARTILMNPLVLVLDEVTSSLDAIQEARIRDLIAAMAREKTVIVIAHRLSTIRWVGNIYVLWNGSIVESGSYESLLKRRGHLYLLHTLQHWSFGDFRRGMEDQLRKYTEGGPPSGILIVTSEGGNDEILSFFLAHAATVNDSGANLTFDHLVSCCFPTETSAMFLFAELDQTKQERLISAVNAHSDGGEAGLKAALLLIDTKSATAEECIDHAMQWLDNLKQNTAIQPVIHLREIKT